MKNIPNSFFVQIICTRIKTNLKVMFTFPYGNMKWKIKLLVGSYFVCVCVCVCVEGGRKGAGGWGDALELVETFH